MAKAVITLGHGSHVIHDSQRRALRAALEPDCGGYAIDTLAGHDVLVPMPSPTNSRSSVGAPASTVLMPRIGGDAA